MGLLQRLIELAEPEQASPLSGGSQMGLALAEGVAGATVTDADSFHEFPPRAAESRAKTRQLCDDMLADIQEGGVFAPPSMEALTKHAREAAEEGGGAAQDAQPEVTTPVAGVQLGDTEPTLVCIVDFEPPESHRSQMLKICVGELVTV